MILAGEEYYIRKVVKRKNCYGKKYLTLQFKASFSSKYIMNIKELPFIVHIKKHPLTSGIYGFAFVAVLVILLVSGIQQKKRERMQIRMINNEVQRENMMQPGMMQGGGVMQAQMMEPEMNPELMMAQGNGMTPAKIQGQGTVRQVPSRRFNTNGMRPPQGTRIPVMILK